MSAKTPRIRPRYFVQRCCEDKKCKVDAWWVTDPAGHIEATFSEKRYAERYVRLLEAKGA